MVRMEKVKFNGITWKIPGASISKRISHKKFKLKKEFNGDAWY
jgi:hypothetical protein